MSASSESGSPVSRTIPLKRSTLRLRLLEAEDCARLRTASFRILEEIGMQVDDKEALGALLRTGCCEGGESRLHFSEESVLRALERVPHRLVLFGQNGEPRIDTVDAVPHFGLGFKGTSRPARPAPWRCCCSATSWLLG